MSNLPVTHIKTQADWRSVIISASYGIRLINVFTRLNTKVGRRFINEYKRLIEHGVIGNQRFVGLLRVGTRGVAAESKLMTIKLT